VWREPSLLDLGYVLSYFGKLRLDVMRICRDRHEEWHFPWRDLKRAAKQR